MRAVLAREGGVAIEFRASSALSPSPPSPGRGGLPSSHMCLSRFSRRRATSWEPLEQIRPAASGRARASVWGKSRPCPTRARRREARRPQRGEPERPARPPRGGSARKKISSTDAPRHAAPSPRRDAAESRVRQYLEARIGGSPSGPPARVASERRPRSRGPLIASCSPRTRAAPRV